MATKGHVSVAVVDANAVIQSDRLVGMADRYVSVKEVLDEVRDPTSRRRVAFLPFDIETIEPEPEFIKKVVKFARETGDLQSLSDVDIKLIALTYMLESQSHGTAHLKEHPPPLRVLNVKKFQETQMPGWGSNVENLAEWEALDELNETDSGSHILPLKDLDGNSNGNVKEVVASDNLGDENIKEIVASDNLGDEKKGIENLEVGLKGKKMVACGVDASKGEERENDDGDWVPAVSRSTHRRYLRRQMRRHERESIQQEENLKGNVEDGSADLGADERESGETEKSVDDDVLEEEMDKLEIGSEMEGSVDASIGEDSSEQSWMLGSLSDSSVACVTADFAMQNVLLQIGLHLLAPGGMQIRQLHRWVLKCHACLHVTQEIGRIFCPKCGNGGTLRKVSVTVQENGIVLAARKQRFQLRGTKFSLPLPQGGRDAITKNPVLREDQLPQKLLYPKTKKKSQDDDYLTQDSLFLQSGERKAPLKPPVRKALAMFSGKRNPNDNHFGRRKA
ncbi:hypothetical protein LUZ60_009371 [Juncus effusus]|nr:hypothetical protein LUZ60_009371 [Juncus effusus]